MRPSRLAPDTFSDRMTSQPSALSFASCVSRSCSVVLTRFGRLDILVNDAGRGMKYVSEAFLTEPTRFWEVAPETWRMVIDTNVNGPFLMARAAVLSMLQSGWGRIINISMNYETMRRRGFSPYGPSKAALESETVIWAQDLAGTGVTVKCAATGRRHADRHDPARRLRGCTFAPARSRHYRSAAAVARLA